MKMSESEKIKKMVDQVISFIKWRGMSIQEKEKAIIGKIAAIRTYCNIKEKKE